MKKAQDNVKTWIKEKNIRYSSRVFGLTCLSVCSILFSLTFAYLMRYLVSSAQDNNKNKLFTFFAVILFVMLMRIAFSMLWEYFSERLRSKITKELRVSLFDKALRMDYERLQGYHSGEMMTRLTADVQEISSVLATLKPRFISAIVQFVGAIVALLTIDVLFTSFYLIGGVAIMLTAAIFRKKIKVAHKDFMKNEGKFRSFMQESISSSLTLKAYSVEGKTTDKAKDLGEIYHQKRMKRTVLFASMHGLFSLLANLGLIFAVIWCSISILNGNDDYGAILSIILLLSQAQQPLSSFTTLISARFAYQASVERVIELESFETETADKGETIAYENVDAIEVNNLTFAYEEDSVFSQANAVFHLRKTACFVGASGSGKSTLFKLFLRIFKQNDGKIVFTTKDGTSVDLSTETRNLFAYVPQGNFLFSGSIYENLTFFAGEKNPTDDAIKNALQIACAEFVDDLPEGLQTRLGEGGEGLSEGQLQRLAVARAILSNRPILLLDEATSALDIETEKRLLNNIQTLTDKTCFIVTHRPAAISLADDVYLIEKGKIIKQ